MKAANSNSHCACCDKDGSRYLELELRPDRAPDDPPIIVLLFSQYCEEHAKQVVDMSYEELGEVVCKVTDQHGIRYTTILATLTAYEGHYAERQRELDWISPRQQHQALH